MILNMKFLVLWILLKNEIKRLEQIEKFDKKRLSSNSMLKEKI